MIRYCPHCDDEFRPGIERCSDCGGELEDRYEDESGAAAHPDAGEPETEAAGPPEDYQAVFRCLDSPALKQAAGCLAAAGIPFRATGCSTGFQLLVLAAEVPAASSALQGREGSLYEPGDAAPTVGDEGGSCPACGASVPAAQVECPECGLVVGGEPAAED